MAVVQIGSCSGGAANLRARFASNIPQRGHNLFKIAMPSYGRLYRPGSDEYNVVFLAPAGEGTKAFFLDGAGPGVLVQDDWRIEVLDSMFEYFSLSNPKSGASWFAARSEQDARGDDIGAIELAGIVEATQKIDISDASAVRQAYDTGRDAYAKSKKAFKTIAG